MVTTLTLPPFPHARSVPAAAARLAAHAITLRPATNDDLPLLARLYAGFRKAEMLFMPWSASEKRAFFDDQFRLQHSHFVRHFRHADFWIVCNADSTPIGRFYLDRSTREWRLIDILLTPGARGRGIGSALIHWAQTAAAKTGASGIALHVAINNPSAHALYTRMGFIEGASQDGLHIPMLWRVGET